MYIGSTRHVRSTRKTTNRLRVSTLKIRGYNSSVSSTLMIYDFVFEMAFVRGEELRLLTRRYCHGPNACNSSDHDVRQKVGLVLISQDSSSSASSTRRLNAKRRGSTCAIGWPCGLDSSPTDVLLATTSTKKPSLQRECRPSLLVGCLLTRNRRSGGWVHRMPATSP